MKIMINTTERGEEVRVQTLVSTFSKDGSMEIFQPRKYKKDYRRRKESTVAFPFTLIKETTSLISVTMDMFVYSSIYIHEIM